MSTGLFAAPGNGAHYCGATAISAVTGMPITRVEDFVLAHRTRVPKPARKGLRNKLARVTTMWSSEIEPVCASIGACAYDVALPIWRRGICAPTFTTWLRLHRDPKLTYIVLITGHYVAVCGDELVDTLNRQPVSLKTFRKYNRARVRAAWRVDA